MKNRLRKKERERERICQTERKPDRLTKNRVRKPNRTVPPLWRYELIPYRTRYGQFLGHTVTVTVIEPIDALPHIPIQDFVPCLGRCPATRDVGYGIVGLNYGYGYGMA